MGKYRGEGQYETYEPTEPPLNEVQRDKVIGSLKIARATLWTIFTAEIGIDIVRAYDMLPLLIRQELMSPEQSIVTWGMIGLGVGTGIAINRVQSALSSIRNDSNSTD